MFPLTATKLLKESHSDRTMDAALLRWSSGWLSFIVGWCTATAENRKKVWEHLRLQACYLYKPNRCYWNRNVFCMNHHYQYFHVDILYIDRHVSLKYEVWTFIISENGEREARNNTSLGCSKILIKDSVLFCFSLLLKSITAMIDFVENKKLKLTEKFISRCTCF